MAHLYPPISEVISPKARAVVYTVFAFLGLGLGGTQVGYAAAEAGQPTWLTVALAVYAFLGSAFGYTAVTHTPKDEEVARLRG